jgi:hypothetical protein
MAGKLKPLDVERETRPGKYTPLRSAGIKVGQVT